MDKVDSFSLIRNEPDGMMIGFVLSDISRYFKKALEKSVVEAGLGLTSGEIRTLSYVFSYGGSRQSVLAELMGVRSMTISVFIDRLVTTGLVRRAPDPTDNRANIICLTETAYEAMEKIKPAAEKVLQNAIKNVTDLELKVAIRCLQAMAFNMKPEVNQKTSR